MWREVEGGWAEGGRVGGGGEGQERGAEREGGGIERGWNRETGTERETEGGRDKLELFEAAQTARVGNRRVALETKLNVHHTATVWYREQKSDHEGTGRHGPATREGERRPPSPHTVGRLKVTLRPTGWGRVGEGEGGAIKHDGLDLAVVRGRGGNGRVNQ